MKQETKNKLVKQDMNFLEYPLWFQNERLPEGFVWTDRDGFTYRAGYKPPTRVDGLYLMYWMLCSQNEGWAEHICLSQRENMTACGITPGKDHADRLKDSLERWINVTVKYEGTFYNGGDHQTVQFNVINDWGLTKVMHNLEIDLNKFWLEKVQNSQFFKLLNFDEMRKLRTAVAMRIYEILVKNFQNRDEWSIDAHKLAAKMPMDEKYLSHIIPKIETALDRINSYTSLHVKLKTEYYGRGKAILCFSKIPEKVQLNENPAYHKPAKPVAGKRQRNASVIEDIVEHIIDIEAVCEPDKISDSAPDKTNQASPEAHASLAETGRQGLFPLINFEAEDPGEEEDLPPDATREERVCLNLLRHISGYPFEYEKDFGVIHELFVDFPTLDLSGEIKSWKTWLIDNSPKGNVNYRSRLRRWLKKAVKYEEEKHGCDEQQYGNSPRKFDPYDGSTWGFSEKLCA